jgi:thymidine kinase
MNGADTMAKLYFRYGSMGSSKTANALMVKYNYEERGQTVCFLKPEIDARDGKNIIRSRIGLQSEVTLLHSNRGIIDTLQESSELINYHCVIVDEAQFLSKAQVEELCTIVDKYNIPVICYGLRADFKGNLFEGSHWLLAWADSVEEVKTICFCGKKAIMNMRIIDGKPVFEGEQIQIGGNDSYISVCRKHWKEGKYQHLNNHEP